MEWIDLLLHWLGNTPLAVFVAKSDWAFPIIETVHVIALALIVGSVGVLDLRLLGWASAKRPYRELAREVLPWTWAAFCLAVISGSLMFITQAAEYYGNAAFRVKMLLLLLAGINVLIFEFVVGPGATGWDHDAPTPWSARIAAALSLTLWIAIVFFGRRIGFTMAPG